jgi:hypothetical protein
MSDRYSLWSQCGDLERLLVIINEIKNHLVRIFTHQYQQLEKSQALKAATMRYAPRIRKAFDMTRSGLRTRAVPQMMRRTSKHTRGLVRVCV